MSRPTNPVLARGWIALGALGLIGGCAVVLDFDGYQAEDGAGSGQGGEVGGTAVHAGSGGSGAEGGSGGVGGSVGCTTPDQCDGIDTECAVRTCVDNVCGWELMLEGTTITDKSPGNCKASVCGPGGMFEEVPDDGDPLTDNNECTNDLCLPGGMETQHLNVLPGIPCGGGDDVACDGMGECRGCMVASDCPMSTGCLTWSCMPGGLCVAQESMVCGTCQYCLEGDCTNYPAGADPEDECMLGCNGAGECSVE